MNIAILQLSDIHLRSTSDLSNKMLPEIGKVFQSAEYTSISNIIVALAGDIAFSGKKEEYDIAYQLLLEANKNIQAAKPDAAITWICTPGNHDCDFSEESTFRQMILSTLPNPTTKLSKPDVIAECLKVQKTYREFVAQPLFTKASISHYDLVDEYLIKTPQANLCFRCYNTAWVSQLHEQPGRMSFPRACMQEDESWGRGDLNISILHHPTHWLLPNRKRLMSQHLDRLSDLLLLGHEHLPEQFIKSDFSGNSLGVVYGGVFQEDIHNLPGQFNIIVFDPIQYQFKLNSYRRSGTYFEKENTTERWLPIRRLSRTMGGRFELSESFLEWLVDTDADFSHPSGKKLTLEDVFVIPDFDELISDVAHTKAPKLIKGEALLAKIHESPKLIFYGDEKSGKTTLAKYLFLQFIDEGNVPLYIDGKKIELEQIKSPATLIESAFHSCYQTAGIGGFDALPTSSKILIVDDFHKTKLNHRGRAKLLEQLTSIADTVIILGDRMMFMDEVSEGMLVDHKAEGFIRLRFREMGRYARRRLIMQWYSLGVEYSERGDSVSRRVAEAESSINNLLGKSLLPRFPVFVLGFLGNLDAARQNKDIGTYGYIYESAITNSLLRGGTTIQLDIKYDFLAFIAHQLHREDKDSFSVVDFKYYYRKFSEEIGRDPGYETLAQELFGSEILINFDDEIRFRYAYCYFFFIARHFRDNLGQVSIREEIERMAKSLTIEKNANIWLFLVHQSKDQFLLDCIVGVANSVFSSAEPSKLESEIEFIRKMKVVIPDKLLLPATHAEDNIRSTYDKSDERDARHENDNEDISDEELHKFTKEVEAMVRTVVVLGQLVRNFPALKVSYKKSLVIAALGAALRGLNTALNRIESGKTMLAAAIAELIQKEHPTLDRIDLEDRVKGSLFWIFEANVFSLIRLVSTAVGAVGEEATFRESLCTFSSKASKLIGISIGLDTLKIPRSAILSLKDELRGDLFNTHILRGLVANHIYMFPVRQELKDELCEKLNIIVGDRERRERSLGYRHRKG